MKWKEFISEYLTFSRKERVGILIILLLILLLILVSEMPVTSKHSSLSGTDTAWSRQFNSWENNRKKTTSNPSSGTSDTEIFSYPYDLPAGQHPKNVSKLFYFDPNTLSAEGWNKMGLRNKTIQTIQNYLMKGGRFKKPEDLKKIYGLFADEYERISPFIIIDSKTSDSGKNSFTVHSEFSTPKTYPARWAAIDINTADTSAFISLPGIGNRLAARIIAFREKLGGFYSVSQVAETYGLPDSVFQKIQPCLKREDIPVKKININTATVDELKAHPYIRWNLANPIVAYRNEHGLFEALEKIKNVMAVTEEVYKKISPYLSVQ